MPSNCVGEKESLMWPITDTASVESLLLQITPDAMLVVDRSGWIGQANSLAEQLFGYPAETLAGQPLAMLIPERLRHSHQRHIAAYLCDPSPRSMGAGLEFSGLRRDGSEFAAEIGLNPLATPQGLHVLVTIRDTSESRRAQQALEQATAELERKVETRNAELLRANAELRQQIAERAQAEAELFEAKERAQVTLHSIGDAVLTTDASAVVEYLNPVAESLTGWRTAEARGRPLGEIFRIVGEQSRQPMPDPVARCLQEGKTIGLTNHALLINRHGQEYHITESAAPIRGGDGRVLGAVLVFHDVTENRQLARQLEHDATHDALTGLINRAEFERRLARALASAQQYGTQHALCYLDLDQFKIVNDTAGHAAGDELLRQINIVLSGMFRERDTLARIGGDEFGLLLDNCPLDRAQLIAQTVVGDIRDHRFHWEGRAYQIGVSIGLTPITAEAQDTAQLLTQADVACYIAKEMGRNRVHLYQREDTETAQRHGEILGAAGLRDSLEQDRFRLHYQPIIPLSEPIPRPTRYEALLRVVYKSSQDANTEVVLPAAFIPAAERYGMMGAIDRWVIQAAFREYANGVGQTGAQIAINLSGNSLSDETLLGFIEAQFTEQAFPPERVCFEITETAAIQNLRPARELMAALKRRGSQFALDDFGSGLSSFRYLKTLPVDYLKIDGSFVKDMIENPNDCALVAAINQMSHALGIQTIAEYVESQAIVDRLRELKVDYAQGFFFGHAAPWGQLP
jgi:diguanylate cyclase (GGDEF)-like protein/PAS domain S-box-containing protein